MKHLGKYVSTALLTGLLVYVLVREGPGVPPEPGFTSAGLARVLFTDYVLQFELVGVLICVAMVGAVFLAMKGETW
ncbi:MAG: hypothetical protein MAG715_00203 [Methanonatronarchaeales archaeon]|nr:hypothetical protein [Methanonatronarchaeales archaeon]